MKSTIQLLIAGAVLASCCASAAEPADVAAARANRRAEIEFYTTGFDGGANNFGCVRPPIPPTSKTNDDITKVDKSVQDWFACYNVFVQSMNDALPAGKTIPADLAKIMTPEETALARARMNEVYGAIGEDAQRTATEIVAQHEAWRASTVLYATTTNEETKKKLAAEMLKYEVWKNSRLDSKMDNNFGGKGGGVRGGR
jgi:hypothetical protein